MSVCAFRISFTFVLSALPALPGCSSSRQQPYLDHCSSLEVPWRCVCHHRGVLDPRIEEGGKGRRRAMKAGLDTKRWRSLGMTGPQTQSEPVQMFSLTSVLADEYIEVSATANQARGAFVGGLMGISSFRNRHLGIPCQYPCSLQFWPLLSPPTSSHTDLCGEPILWAGVHTYEWWR